MIYITIYDSEQLKQIQSNIDSLHGPQPLTFRFMIHGWIQTSLFWFVMSWEYSVCRVFVSCWPRGMSCAFWNPRTSSHRRWLQTCIEWLRKCTICNFMQHLVTGVGVKAAWHMSDIYGTALSGWQNQVTKSWHVENVGKQNCILYCMAWKNIWRTAVPVALWDESLCCSISSQILVHVFRMLLGPIASTGKLFAKAQPSSPGLRDWLRSYCIRKKTMELDSVIYCKGRIIMYNHVLVMYNRVNVK